jgi:26S proteasome regulatory subunit N10
MRNGDYSPTRLVAQNEAVNLIFSSKTQSNPENTVGLMTTAGKGPEVLVTLTTDVGKILTALHAVKAGGKPNFLTSVQIAQVKYDISKRGALIKNNYIACIET